MARIIVAEDDEIVGQIVCDTLIASGHGVGLLTDGAEALRIICIKKPDLAILDCNMPGLAGVTVLRALRRSFNMCKMPVLILTARQSARDVELAMHEGADDYVKKPFDPTELAFRVDQLLARKRETGTHFRHSQKAGFGNAVPR